MRQRLPSPYGQRIDRDRPVSAQFDGRDLPAFDGDSVASAIVASGQWVVSRSFKYHRRYFCTPDRTVWRDQDRRGCVGKFFSPLMSQGHMRISDVSIMMPCTFRK